MEAEDPFNALLYLEDALLQEGRQNGRLNAHQAAFDQGRLLGLQKGSEVGRELGSYVGHLLLWHHLSAQPQPTISEGGSSGTRRRAVLDKLRELTRSFPRDPTKEDLFEHLDRIRGKYRQAASLLRAPSGATTTTTTETTTGQPSAAHFDF